MAPPLPHLVLYTWPKGGKVSAMNSFTSFFLRMNERTKLLLVGVVAFSAGMMFKGSSSTNGRYQPCGNSLVYVLDTQNGSAWELRNGRYERLGAMPW
jgi:hypothetical protein